VSYETSRRGREYGVRLALGATPSQINGMVLRQTARLGVAGILIGVCGMVAIIPLLDRWVFGVSRLDPLTFVSVAGVLCVTTMLAALGPAVRASRSDPMTSLRSD
jgi:ABC-type antimicrobial peptide transport system permease subunit